MLSDRADVTYDEAKRWLAKIGGQWKETREGALPRPRGTVLVSVTSAKGPLVQRQAFFDDATQGFEREFEIRRAFIRACDELRRALA